VESLDFRCCLGGGCTVVARTEVLYRDFFFLVFFFFLWLYASVLLLGYCVDAEAGFI
jgi:hypothetical protein